MQHPINEACQNHRKGCGKSALIIGGLPENFTLALEVEEGFLVSSYIVLLLKSSNALIHSLDRANLCDRHVGGLGHDAAPAGKYAG